MCARARPTAIRWRESVEYFRVSSSPLVERFPPFAVRAEEIGVVAAWHSRGSFRLYVCVCVCVCVLCVHARASKHLYLPLRRKWTRTFADVTIDTRVRNTFQFRSDISCRSTTGAREKWCNFRYRTEGRKEKTDAARVCGGVETRECESNSILGSWGQLEPVGTHRASYFNASVCVCVYALSDTDLRRESRAKIGYLSRAVLVQLTAPNRTTMHLVVRSFRGR